MTEDQPSPAIPATSATPGVTSSKPKPVTEWAVYLRRMREELELSQTMLAAMVGIHLNTIGVWENSHATPSKKNQTRIRAMLEKEMKARKRKRAPKPSLELAEPEKPVETAADRAETPAEDEIVADSGPAETQEAPKPTQEGSKPTQEAPNPVKSARLLVPEERSWQ